MQTDGTRKGIARAFTAIQVESKTDSNTVPLVVSSATEVKLKENTYIFDLVTQENSRSEVPVYTTLVKKLCSDIVGPSIENCYTLNCLLLGSDKELVCFMAAIHVTELFLRNHCRSDADFAFVFCD